MVAGGLPAAVAEDQRHQVALLAGKRGQCVHDLLRVGVEVVLVVWPRCGYGRRLLRAAPGVPGWVLVGSCGLGHRGSVALGRVPLRLINRGLLMSVSR